MSSGDDCDKFAMIGDNASEAELAMSSLPAVARRSFAPAPAQSVIAITWGGAAPELVLLHGGGHNAHTWDTLVLAGWPAIGIDLPGHGHSNWRSDRDYGPWRKDRSYWPRSGWASSPTNMAGTPSKMVARSRRIAASKQRQDRDHHVVGLDVEQAPGDVRVHAELHVRQLGGLGAGCRPRQHAGPGDEIRAPQWPRWNPTSGACSRPAASRSESASSSP